MFSKVLGRSQKSVSSVIGAFNKMLEDLKAVEIHHEQEASRQAEIIVQAQAAHDASISEASLAREVQSRLAAIAVPATAPYGAQALINN